MRPAKLARVPTPNATPVRPSRLRCAVVLGVSEDGCDAWTEGRVVAVRFAPLFPRPRTERVSPGHLVALATTPHGDDIVVWRWYDAVVVDSSGSGPIRLWEPGHGEVLARARDSHRRGEPGSRAYASAGLPGADWWVAGSVVPLPEIADVELSLVDELYTDNGLWPSALAPGPDPT